MLRRLLARLRRRPPDHRPRHSISAPAAPTPARRSPPPPPSPPAGEPTGPVRPGIQVLPEPPAPAEAVPAGEGGYEAGGARVSFVLRDGSVARPPLDEEAAAHMDHVVRGLLDQDGVRRTT